MHGNVVIQCVITSHGNNVVKINGAHDTIISTLKSHFKDWPQKCTLSVPGLLYFILKSS